MGYKQKIITISVWLFYHQSDKEKGVSTVIATLLMLIITIALAGTTYAYISGVFTSKTNSGFSVSDVYSNSITIRNDGNSPIPVSSITSVSADGNPVSYSVVAQGTQINAGATATFTITGPLSAGTHTVQICVSSNCRSGYMYLAFSSAGG